MIQQPKLFIGSPSFICCLNLVNVWLKFGSNNNIAIVFLNTYSHNITANVIEFTVLQSYVTVLRSKKKHDSINPTHILSFQREKQVILLGLLFPSGVILPLRVRTRWLVTKSRWISLQEERGSSPRISLEGCRRSGHLEENAMVCMGSTAKHRQPLCAYSI